METENYESELEEQLQQQQVALSEIQEALQLDESSEELQEMQQELSQSIAELEQALLEVKKAKLLASLGATQAAARTPAAAAPEAGRYPAGQHCRFRYTDGRWYHGQVHSSSAQSASVRFSHPIRGFMLQLCQVPAQLVAPCRAPPHLSAADMEAGCEVLARHPLSSLYARAELLALPRPGTDAVVKFPEEAGRRSVSLADLILSPYADDSGDDVGSSGLSDGCSSGDDDGDDDSDVADADDEDHVGLGAAWDPFAHAREAAAAGRQTDTAHFADWEAHSRGIASKLLAGMGYVRGRGLGRAGQGIAEPLQVSLRPNRRGLGEGAADASTAGKKRKKKRGGQRARVKRHMQAQREVKEGKEQQQHKLEAATGSSGLFAFINHHLGTGSDAAAVRRATEGPRTAGAAALAPPSRPAGEKPLSRRELVAAAEKISVAQARLARLREMLKRNASDKVLAPQIQLQLQQATQQLQDAQAQHAHATKSQSDRDAQKKWLKF